MRRNRTGKDQEEKEDSLAERGEGTVKWKDTDEEMGRKGKKSK